jgi:hypothetical protein
MARQQQFGPSGLVPNWDLFWPAKMSGTGPTTLISFVNFGRHRAAPWHLSVMETPNTRSRLTQERRASAVMERRRFKEETPLDQRLEDHAKRLRNEARGTPAGIKRDDLIRQARQAETAAHLNGWNSSPGLRPPK